MGQSKEEILHKLQKDNPHSIPTFKAMDEYAKQEVLSELQALVEMQCHPEYLKMAIIDRISEIKNPSQLP